MPSRRLSSPRADASLAGRALLPRLDALRLFDHARKHATEPAQPVLSALPVPFTAALVLAPGAPACGARLSRGVLASHSAHIGTQAAPGEQQTCEAAAQLVAHAFRRFHAPGNRRDDAPPRTKASVSPTEEPDLHCPLIPCARSSQLRKAAAEGYAGSGVRCIEDRRRRSRAVGRQIPVVRRLPR